MAGLLVAGGKLVAGRGGVIARGRRTTTSTATTTEVGVLRLDDIPIVSGRLYRISTNALVPDTSVNNDVIRAHIRYTTSGGTPTTSSTVLPGSPAQIRQADANNGESVTIETYYSPGSDQTLSLLLCVTRVSGTGSVTLFADATSGFTIDLAVEDVGVDPGDTGTDI